LSAHERLRRETRAAHERVDARFSALNLRVEDDYRRFLMLHAIAFLPVEKAVTDAGAARLVEDWEAMRRTPELLADLQALGLAAPSDEGGPCFNDDAEMLGAIYVLEGSRLGGAALRKSIDPTFPHRFLAHPQPKGRWRVLVALLERNLGESVRVDSAVEAALGAFAFFERAEWDRGD
jgi:heme oxygenase